MFSPSPRLDGKSLAFFFRQLGMLLTSGVPLVQAWKLLTSDMKKKRRQALHTAALHMEQGIRPSLAMSRCQAFPTLACRLIEAGEQTGNLDTICQVLADFYTRAEKDRRVFFEALAYPVFLLACLLLLMTGAVFFIIPVFVDMMAQMDVAVPKGTQYLLSVCGWLRRHGIYIPLGISLTSFFLGRAWLDDTYRLAMERAVLRIPGIQSLFLAWAWQRFSRILAVQLSAGIPLLECLSGAGAVVPSLSFQNYVRRLRFRLERGQTFSRAVHDSPYGTAYIETMLTVGEMTGKYDDALTAIALYYDSRLRRWAAGMQRWLGPFVLILVGVFMGFLLFSLLLPLLDMASSVVTS